MERRSFIGRALALLGLLPALEAMASSTQQIPLRVLEPGDIYRPSIGCCWSYPKGANMVCAVSKHTFKDVDRDGNFLRAGSRSFYEACPECFKGDRFLDADKTVTGFDGMGFMCTDHQGVLIRRLKKVNLDTMIGTQAVGHTDGVAFWPNETFLQRKVLPEDAAQPMPVGVYVIEPSALGHMLQVMRMVQVYRVEYTAHPDEKFMANMVHPNVTIVHMSRAIAEARAARSLMGQNGRTDLVEGFDQEMSGLMTDQEMGFVMSTDPGW